MRRPLLRLLAVAAVAALAFAGLSCGSLTGSLTPNPAPETIVFVSGPLDTVNHIVHLHWFGSTPHGYVSGYELRLLNPEAPDDSMWHFTPLTDSLFTVYTPQGHTAPIFEVRAINNEGVRDPSPARQLFSFSNQPPTVRLILRPGARDTTFASVTVGWTVTDVDGDALNVRYLVWLNGHAADPEMTTERVFTMPSDRFLVGGQYTSGPRTLYVRGIDDGGMAGPLDSVTWQVKKPVAGSRARLLIVDDVPRTTAANTLIDTLYTNTANRNIPLDSYTVLRLDFNQPFLSAKDVEQTFKLFETVIWYRGNLTTVSTTLRDYQDGVGPYLEAGGRFYLDGLYLFSGVNAPGALREEFAQRYLNCDGFLKCFQTVQGGFTDSTIGWGNVNGSVFRSTMFADSSRQQQLGAAAGEAGGLRVFRVRNNAQVALMAPPGTLTPTRPDSLVVGVSVAQPSGGRAIILGIPMGTSLPANASSGPRFLAKVFGQLGLTGS
jgi:hypothetical protein